MCGYNETLQKSNVRQETIWKDDDYHLVKTTIHGAVYFSLQKNNVASMKYPDPVEDRWRLRVASMANDISKRCQALWQLGAITEPEEPAVVKTTNYVPGTQAGMLYYRVMPLSHNTDEVPPMGGEW